ncbi:hypothetical protein CE143_20515 [Photorhabdus luminescens]|uniref:Uncharacterized protein n=3 Tax=Photorhabdus TaxID=29487 RepID=A0A4R4JNQ3_PHOLU|nr:hypothetical protein [Photorhabdus caribbeanensis]MBS9429923.1 hypothetical protein [Photorhabdus akhurstii]MBS9435124.1 hypothetical protein [Photorhabdus hainanensis]MBS9437361.1 hypothetical protein [Photorhabdus noenieputensis]OWO81265.1 hypothetical protein B5C26_13795 [Photorhabdus luminescens]PQQ24750.1 hypothetical protein C6H66_14465 [Photorhabdus hindustanensis]TDB55973.1 hypothetical protein C5468_01800 [Photorhabdus luminescens subsp. mexicana]
MREYCANTRENFLHAYLIDLWLRRVNGEFSVHHTSTNIAKIRFFVTRFIKICDEDWCLTP